MSYCRFSKGEKTYFQGTDYEYTPEKSDVYLYEDYLGYFNCCGCRLIDKGFISTSRQEMINHLKEHIKAGDTVPDHVIPTLLEEIKVEGDLIFGI